jgi:hypothetical protein
MHEDRGPLHGITLIVDTTGGDTWVGRCDVSDARGVWMKDADLYRGAGEGAGTGAGKGAGTGAERDQFLRRAAQVGVWPRHREVHIPANEVAAMRRLTEWEA